MSTELTLRHNLIGLPSDKLPSDTVTERHELELLFDCEKSNPNGDPDTGNMPRLQPDSLKGLVTDVCLKRKLRNFFSLYTPHEAVARPWQDGEANPEPRNGYEVFIRESAILQKTMERDDIEKLAQEIFDGYKDKDKGKWKRPPKDKEGKESRGETEFIQRAYRDVLCKAFVDIRAFGGVVSTSGPLHGTFYGQIRGPFQVTFAQSLDKVLQLDSTITRCAVANDKERKQVESESGDNRTMGRKHGIDYGLYRCHIHFSPAFAAKTGFTYYDLDNFLFALKHMFVDDHAAGRHLRLVGLVDFQHQSSLGNALAHKLFELVKVEGIKERKNDKEVFKSSGSEFPQGLFDYSGQAPGSLEKHEPVPGYEGKGIVARQIVWEIPAAK